MKKGKQLGRFEKAKIKGEKIVEKPQFTNPGIKKKTINKKHQERTKALQKTKQEKRLANKK